MTCRVPSLTLVAILAMVAALGIPSGPAVARSGLPGVGLSGVAVPGVDVHGDDEADVYVGTGGLVLPGTTDRGVRRQVAACADCQWRLATPCLRSPLGHAFDGQSPCTSVVRGCTGGARLLRTWFRSSVAARWREIGLVCIGPQGPVTVREAGERAVDRFVEGMPRLGPSFQPGQGIVAQVPVVFGSGQPAGAVQHDYRLLDAEVRLDATPTWAWDFGDGGTLRTTDPGGTHPHDAVAHTYRWAGEYLVVVTTRWTASFTVDGLGPFPVPEPISQEQRLRVLVGEGRALLAP